MYYRTDEEAEAAEALCMASRLADGLERDIRLWRWVVIALHNAVQGFMVLSLRHGNGLAALTPESAAAWLEAYEKGGPYPDEKLDSYLCLYKKIKSTEHGTLGNNRRFVPRGTQGDSIHRLNRIRNEFIHFTPKGWFLEVDGLPRISIDCLAVVSFLGWETENIFWHEPDHKERAQLCHSKLIDQMTKLKAVYEKLGS